MKCVETGQNCTTVPCASCPRAPRPAMPTAPLRSSRYSADDRKTAAEWLRDCAKDAGTSDRSVGIFSNEDLASLFNVLATAVECNDYSTLAPRSERGTLPNQPAWATLHKALYEAHTHIERLAKIVQATRGEAFKDWAMGEREPYTVAQRAIDFVYQPLPSERKET